MTFWQWISFAFTCGIFVGHWVPRFVEYLFERPVNKGYKKRGDKNVDKSKNTK